jgi:hypothetical protein
LVSLSPDIVVVFHLWMSLVDFLTIDVDDDIKKLVSRLVVKTWPHVMVCWYLCNGTWLQSKSTCVNFLHIQSRWNLCIIWQNFYYTCSNLVIVKCDVELIVVIIFISREVCIWELPHILTYHLVSN